MILNKINILISIILLLVLLSFLVFNFHIIDFLHIDNNVKRNIFEPIIRSNNNIKSINVNVDVNIETEIEKEIEKIDSINEREKSENIEKIMDFNKNHGDMYLNLMNMNISSNKYISLVNNKLPLVVNLAALKRSEIAILQFDSRKLSDYWHASAIWNKKYCDEHGHIYIYYSTPNDNSKKNTMCAYEEGNVIDSLASPWCKVKSMLRANSEYKDIKIFLYLDSDAVVDYKYKDVPMNNLLMLMQQRLNWNPEKKPIIFNQDGPCWWCSMIKNKGYSMCLNAGTVMWYRHSRSEEVLRSWWESSMDSYATNPIKRPFRTKWPWEQDRQMAVYNRTPEFIQIASQPLQNYMNLNAGKQDWCLSHLPVSGCFISHHCENKQSKKRMMMKYSIPGQKLELNVNILT